MGVTEKTDSSAEHQQLGDYWHIMDVADSDFQVVARCLNERVCPSDWRYIRFIAKACEDICRI